MKIHMVKKGDTLYQIAKKYNVDLNKLIAANPHIENPDVIDVGMKVKIPLSYAPAPPPAAGEVVEHVVKQGDTLWKLSQQWGVSLKQMIDANPHLKNPSVLMTGQIVYIPVSGAGSGDPSGNVGSPGTEVTGFAKEYTGPVAKEYTGPIAKEYTGPVAKEYTGPAVESAKEQETAPIVKEAELKPVEKEAVQPAEKEAAKPAEKMLPAAEKPPAVQPAAEVPAKKPEAIKPLEAEKPQQKEAPKAAEQKMQAKPAAPKTVQQAAPIAPQKKSDADLSPLKTGKEMQPMHVAAENLFPQFNIPATEASSGGSEPAYGKGIKGYSPFAHLPYGTTSGWSPAPHVGAENVAGAANIPSSPGMMGDITQYATSNLSPAQHGNIAPAANVPSNVGAMPYGAENAMPNVGAMPYAAPNMMPNVGAMPYGAENMMPNVGAMPYAAPNMMPNVGAMPYAAPNAMPAAKKGKGKGGGCGCGCGGHGGYGGHGGHGGHVPYAFGQWTMHNAIPNPFAVPGIPMDPTWGAQPAFSYPDYANAAAFPADPAPDFDYGNPAASNTGVLGTQSASKAAADGAKKGKGKGKGKSAGKASLHSRSASKKTSVTAKRQGSHPWINF